MTSSDTHEEMLEFCHWTMRQKYSKVIFIAGNHDNCLVGNPSMHQGPYEDIGRPEIAYLFDNGIEFEGLKIWGSPWTMKFPGMNPHCMAFTVDTEEELADKFEKIPHDTDILITHSPPYGILDKIVDGRNVGSKYLHAWFKYVERPKLHVFGHIHEAYGQGEFFSGYNNTMVKSVNASHVNEHYQPVNKPIRVIL